LVHFFCNLWGLMSFKFRKPQDKVVESINKRVEFSKKCLEDEFLANEKLIVDLGVELELNENFLRAWWENHYLICSQFQQKFEAFNKPPYHRLSPPKRAAIACYSLFGSQGSPLILANPEPYINTNFEPKHKIPDRTKFRELTTNIEVGLLLRTTAHILKIQYRDLFDHLFGSQDDYAEQDNLIRALLSEYEYPNGRTWLNESYNNKVHMKYIKNMARGIPSLHYEDNTLVAFLNIILLLFSYFDGIWCGTTIVPERNVPLTQGENQDNDLFDYQPFGDIERVLIVDVNKLKSQTPIDVLIASDM